jgi:hypothetical protein
MGRDVRGSVASHLRRAKHRPTSTIHIGTLVVPHSLPLVKLVEASILSPLPFSTFSTFCARHPTAARTLNSSLNHCIPSSSSARTMGKKTPTSKAPVLKLPVADVRVTPKSGWIVKRASYTAVKAIKIRRATATDDND